MVELDDDGGGRAADRNVAAFRIDDIAVDRTTLLARFAEAAQRPRIDVRARLYDAGSPADIEMGADDGHAPRRLPVARFTPVNAFTMDSGAGAPRELQTEAALTLGLHRWRAGLPLRMVDRWVLRCTGDRLDLIGPNAVRFSSGSAELPAGWHAAAQSYGRVLVVYGPASPPRRVAEPGRSRLAPMNTLDGMAAGTVVAGLVQFVDERCKR